MNKLKISFSGNVNEVITVGLVIPFALLFFTARVSPDPLALSPVGLFVAIAFPLMLVITFFKRMHRRWPRFHQVRTLSALLLLANPLNPGLDIPELRWQSFEESFFLLQNPWAWKAAFELDPYQGLAGFAPFFHRPIVTGQPVTLVAVHEQEADFAEWQLMITPHRKIWLDTQGSILHTIPNHALPIQDFILLTDSNLDQNKLHDYALNALQSNCFACDTSSSFEVNNVYAVKAALLEPTSILVGFAPGGYGTVHRAVHDIFSPHISPDWNVRIQTSEGGLSNINGTYFQWYQTQTDTYARPGDLGIITSVELLTFAPVENPLPTLLDNYSWFQDLPSYIEVPGLSDPVYFANPKQYVPNLQDVPSQDLSPYYSLDNPFRNQPFTYPELNTPDTQGWQSPGIDTYSLDNPFQNQLFTDPTFEISDFDSFNTQPLTAPTTNWP